MKILIVSDTHRENENFLKVIENEMPCDMVVHCGDIEGSEYLYSKICKCNLHMIAGNNDFFSSLPPEKEFSIGRYRVFLTHGHDYRVSVGSDMLINEALARECDIVMYGHTHKPRVESVDGIIMVNPGSLTYPRQEGRRPSYIIMNVDNKGEMAFEIKYL